MYSKYVKITPGYAELAALARRGKSHMLIMGEILCAHRNAFIFGRIFVILAGNKDSHKSLDEFRYLLDPITDY